MEQTLHDLKVYVINIKWKRLIVVIEFCIYDLRISFFLLCVGFVCCIKEQVLNAHVSVAKS